ncbi:MAG TPA: hypothetical protein VGK67_26395 [Myxococcales bacterium]
MSEQVWDDALAHARFYAKRLSWDDDAAAVIAMTPEERARTLGGDDAFVDSIADLTDRGVPERIKDLLFRDALQGEYRRPLAETAGLAGAREFVASKLTFLGLLGGVGAGKSVAADWTLTTVRATQHEDPVTRILFNVPGAIRLRDVQVVRSTELARLSKFGDDSETWDELREVPHLVVDDLGVETLNDFWAERLGELIDVRYGARRRTIFTSNLSVAAFKKRYGARVVSRLRDDGLIVSCGVRDLRSRGDGGGAA